MTPNLDDQRLTTREADALRTLIQQRDVYRSNGHGVAARVMGVALFLLWQVFTKTPHDDQLGN